MKRGAHMKRIGSLTATSAIALTLLITATACKVERFQRTTEPPAEVVSEDASPYAYASDREIKALSPEDVHALRAAEGMGMALAAELNGWPGPRHVLDLADQLELTAEQREQIEQVRARMLAEAQRLGEEIITAESTLDSAFARRTATRQQVDQLSHSIGELRGRLRAAHLRAHLETTELLTRHQARLYQRLRGYDEGAEHSGHEHERDSAEQR
jgi:Spy/CpxP family protein refolding chaperone